MRTAPLTVPERHQLRILKQTIKHPFTACLGGPSYEDAERMLREQFDWTAREITKLANS